MPSSLASLEPGNCQVSLAAGTMDTDLDIPHGPEAQGEGRAAISGRGNL